MQTAHEAGVGIRDTGVFGLGAFAMGPIASGVVVGYYEGERPTSAMMAARYWGTQMPTNHSRASHFAPFSLRQVSLTYLALLP
jgi:hypothetical protein